MPRTPPYVYVCYTLVFLCLLTFSIISFLELYVPDPIQSKAPSEISTPTVHVRQVSCAMPQSGQYGLTQRIVWYYLLIGTILPRLLPQKPRIWLGSATSALVYAGIAGVHQILIFAYGWKVRGILGHDAGKWENFCHEFPLGSSNVTVAYPNGLTVSSLPSRVANVLLCPGFDDQDRDAASLIVGTAKLGALPMVAWSTAFDSTDSRPPLLLWVLEIAISHVFTIVSIRAPGPHYQICPVGYSENVPGFSFSAPSLNDAWKAKLMQMLSGGSDLTDECLYTCFKNPNYTIRKSRDLAVFEASTLALRSSTGLGTRKLGVAFWLIYLFFATLAVAETTKPFRNGCYSILRLALSEDMVKDFNQPPKPSQYHDVRRVHGCWGILIWAAVLFLRYISRIMSVVMFVSYIVFLEMRHWDSPQAETISDVGQWGALVAVLQVLVASFFGRIVMRGKREREDARVGANELECANDGNATKEDTRATTKEDKVEMYDVVGKDWSMRYLG